MEGILKLLLKKNLNTDLVLKGKQTAISFEVP